MFLKTAKTQLKNFKEDVAGLICRGNAIIDFCATPILCEFEISHKERQELESMIQDIEKINATLKAIKNILDNE